MKAVLFVILMFTTLTSYGKEPFDESATFAFSSTLAKIHWQSGQYTSSTQSKGTIHLDYQQVNDLDKQQIIAFDASAIRFEQYITLELSSQRGLFDIYSKESKSGHPPAQLVIETHQGIKILRPLVDTYLISSARKALGDKGIVKIGKQHFGLLLFKLPADVLVAPARVKTVTLKITTTTRQYSTANVKLSQIDLRDNVASSVQFGLAEKYPLDKDITQDPHVYFSESFDQRSLWQRLSAKLGVSEPTLSDQLPLIDHQDVDHFSQQQGNAVIVAHTTQKNLALNLDYYFNAHQFDEPEEAYFRYYLMLEPGSNISGGGKLPGFGGTYNKAGWGGRGNDGFKGWSARGAFFKTVQQSNSQWYGHMPIGQYIYEVDRSKYGNTIPWGNKLSAIKPGQWYSIEQRMKLNTPGQKNGILEAWIDGIKVFSKTDVEVRRTPTLKIEKIWFNFYFGGVAKPVHNYNLYLDNIVIASEYIGPYHKF